MTTEKQFENRVKRFLESEGIYRIGTPDDHMETPPCGYWVKRWGGGRYIPDGLPDLQICICGLNFDVELKAENGRVAPLQDQKIRQIRESGAMAVVLRPSDFVEFQKVIKRIKRRVKYDWANELFPKGWK